MDKEVVKELIQDELTVENVRKELDSILHDEKCIQQLNEDYAALMAKLQQQENASEKAAKLIIEFLSATALQKA